MGIPSNRTCPPLACAITDCQKHCWTHNCLSYPMYHYVPVLLSHCHSSPPKKLVPCKGRWRVDRFCKWRLQVGWLSKPHPKRNLSIWPSSSHDYLQSLPLTLEGRELPLLPFAIQRYPQSAWTWSRSIISFRWSFKHPTKNIGLGGHRIYVYMFHHFSSIVKQM